MIRINLLAPENIKKEEPKEIIALAVMIVLLFCAVGIFNYILKIGEYKSLESKINRTERELGKYEGIVKQVETLQSTKAVLETKKNVISSLMAGRLTYPIFMEQFLQLLPQNVWLKSMGTTSIPDGMKVSITAESLDVYSIADLVTALSSNTDFSGVELGAINTSADPKMPTSTFTINFIYKRAKK
jgi:Tfp pilus assembly protein PilN